jgi:hypothetical protein
MRKRTLNWLKALFEAVAARPPCEELSNVLTDAA